MIKLRLGAVLLLCSACASATQQGKPGTDPAGADAMAAAAIPPAAGEPQPILPPKEAFARGWMPLGATGVVEFRKAFPTYDGRGVLIGILDSGIDPGIPGLALTSTGDRKILDLRDFSGEGAVALERAAPNGDTITVAGKRLAGFSRVRTINSAGPWYVGVIRELPLGPMPASDLNGNRVDTDTLAVVVTRASDGWVLFTDTNGDGSLATERPVHDYLTQRETFGWSSSGKAPQITLAANFRDSKGVPSLDLYFDNSAHGSHVAGIAAAHDMYGVKGFDGVAPGAQLLGLKIANNAQGGLSTTGSMLRAVEYAIAFAARRRLPLVLNMSFGVGNEAEGQARIDQLLDSVLAAHPEIVFTISAGNDGPGLSTMGFPGSATRPITVGATEPAIFLGLGPSSRPDPMAYYSSRGGELAKPDLVTPGLAYSTVPRWNIGDERKGGTSMASPHAAGLAALLASAIVQRGGKLEARQIRQALMVTARPLATESYLDDGTGVPNVNAALRWLETPHTLPEIDARPADHGVTAAYRPTGLETPGDTLQAFVLRRSGGAPQSFSLRSNADWLLAPSAVELSGPSARVELTYRAGALRAVGVHTAVVSGWTSDTMAGPIFRLINTVVIPAAGARIETDPKEIPPGGEQRLFFHADSGRPFFVATATTSRSDQALAFLHEPGGQPYREQRGISAGAGEDAALYLVDGRDVVTGWYEAVAVAPPLQSASTLTVVEQSPVVIAASRDPSGITVLLHNDDSTAVTTTPFVALVGAERRVMLVGHNEEESVPFRVPDWAIQARVDVTMDSAQWPRFTDFGLSLFDSIGRQLSQSPLNYAFGRLHLDLPGQLHFPASVMLTPGFADPAGDTRWTAAVSIRLYTDSAKIVSLPGTEVTIPPGANASVKIAMPESALPLGDGFFPLGIVVVPVGDRTWTREVGLPAPTAPLAP